MPPVSRRFGLLLSLVGGLISGIGSTALPGAEIAILDASNWDQFAPAGKEVDAIYGDIVLRNDKLVAVIARPIDGRNANLTMRNVGGALIDFTSRDARNDQLGVFFPLGRAVNWRSATLEPRMSGSAAVKAEKVSAVLAAKLNENLMAETRYELADGAETLDVVTTLRNSAKMATKFVVGDETAVQGTVARGTTGELTWTYDRWWNAAYGVAVAHPKDREYVVPAEGTVVVARKLRVAADLRGLQLAAGVVAADAPTCKLTVRNTAEQPIVGAYVEVLDGKRVVTGGRTNAQGEFAAPAGDTYSATVSHPAYGSQTIVVPPLPLPVTFAAPGIVAAVITDERGGPIPCKVQFRGVGETKNPEFFDKTGEHAVGNLYYSHDGRFALELPPGKYDCTVSRGPEYDAVYEQIEIVGGKSTSLAAKLIRTVQTPGWISGDFHNHSSPSGDNSSSQFGRVLNLLAEQVEFAPCTEHNRVSTYVPHVVRLNAERWMATCSGIELTGSHLKTNHHNAFPLKLHDHHQDGGGPTVDLLDPEANVERLALWDDRSSKVIQQNHPDIGQVFFDKNGDGVPDEGMSRKFGHLDCIEIHPPHFIFSPPEASSQHSATKNNPMFNWLQLLNQGFRVPGVVNTDAHYNIHGSGWLRNYIQSDTDDPAAIDIAAMVHSAEHGHMVMTNGPYLEVTLQATGGTGRPATPDAPGAKNIGIPGDDVAAPGGKAVVRVRVQCANWYDVDRVQVFVNGRPEPSLNFTREKNPDLFTNRTVRFEREIPLALDADAHIVVATIGEKSGLGHVMGPEHEKDPPTAVANPIFVDIDGNGFQPNKDTLGVPLPVKAGDKKK